MRKHNLIRIYTNAPLAQDALVNLGKDQSHYLVNVMRLKAEEELLLFNGVDGEFRGKIVAATKHEVGVRIVKKTKEQYNCQTFALLYAPVKNAKNEFIVQKATEMGVSEIHPVITKHTIKDKVKVERLNLVAIEAAEQCERLDLPEIFEIAELESALKKYSDYKIILCDETGKGDSAAEVLSKLKKKDKYAVLIGPEGGFSDLEISLLHSKKNVYPIGLGPRILRAETAIITALALVQNYLGDFERSPDFRG